MSDRKTHPSTADVDAFLADVESPRRRGDAIRATQIMREVTGVEPVLWATMVGFGRHRYQTADGKWHEYFAVGLAPRRQALVLYGLTFYGSNAELLERLGPHTTGKGCVYVKQLDTCDEDVLRELIRIGWEENHNA